MKNLQTTTCRLKTAHFLSEDCPWPWTENSFTSLSVLKSQNKNSISLYVKIVWNSNFVIQKWCHNTLRFFLIVYDCFHAVMARLSHCNIDNASYTFQETEKLKIFIIYFLILNLANVIIMCLYTYVCKHKHVHMCVYFHI